MKKTILSISLLLLASCSNPATNTLPADSPSRWPVQLSAEGGFSTKSDFVSFLYCLKSKSNVSDESKKQIDTGLQTLANVPDFGWAAVSGQITAGFKPYIENAKAAGCAK